MSEKDPNHLDALMFPPDGERRTRRGEARRTVRAIKAAHSAKRSTMQQFADALTRFSGTTHFFFLHVLWFLVWIPWNTGLLGFEPFDPFPFGLLTMVVSLEAIFLTIFVLMSQSREAAVAELREEVTLQVNLQIEAEVTKALQLMAGLYARLNQRLGEDEELREMLKPLDAESLERELLAQIEDSARRNKAREDVSRDD